MENEIILFETKDREIKLNVAIVNDNVWLSRTQIAELFGRDVKTIGKHINNALREELDDSVVAKFATTAADGKTYQTEHYSLDMIISVGYRVKSKRGIEFRQWANKVLKQYMLQGYAINEKRLKALEKTVDIQTRILAGALDISERDILRAVNEYTEALTLLDQYDHQAICKPQGSAPIYKITYDDCVNMVRHMKDTFNTSVFGVEKVPGKVEGIISAIYQSAFGEEAYPSLEEKAANLLYFVIKDHPYDDGCKRIAASLFLEFLDRNNALFINGIPRLGQGELAALTLLIAESNPEEKEVMTKLTMNLLQLNV
ncbi:MAG: virulence RhuM family protein [Saccharofermentans sp.]|nr:virulence RhuM family protein [Saccharofermentans sp.]